MGYANDVQFTGIDTTGATVHVAIVEGDNEIAVMSYSSDLDGTTVRAIAVYKSEVEDRIFVFFDQEFPSLKAAVSAVAEFLNTEYEGAE